MTNAGIWRDVGIDRIKLCNDGRQQKNNAGAGRARLDQAASLGSVFIVQYSSDLV